MDIIIQVTATLQIEGQAPEYQVNYIDLDIISSEDDIKGEFTEFPDDTDPDDITIEVTDWGSIHKNYQAINNDLWEYVEVCKSMGSIDIVNAGIECGIDLDNIEDAYIGEYNDDDDFAHSIAEETGAINKNANWPMNCIDWEQAAKELMYDYCEDSGYYFRS